MDWSSRSTPAKEPQALLKMTKMTQIYFGKLKEETSTIDLNKNALYMQMPKHDKNFSQSYIEF